MKNKRCVECKKTNQDVKLGKEYPELVKAAAGYFTGADQISSAYLCSECAGKVAADLRGETVQVVAPICHICGQPAYEVAFDASGKAYAVCHAHAN